MLPSNELDEMRSGARFTCSRMKLPVAPANRPVPPVIVRDSTELGSGRLHSGCPVLCPRREENVAVGRREGRALGPRERRAAHHAVTHQRVPTEVGRGAFSDQVAVRGVGLGVVNVRVGCSDGAVERQPDLIRGRDQPSRGDASGKRGRMVVGAAD